MPVPTIPDRSEPQTAAGYLAIMSRAIFQAGVSWKAIAARWDAYERLFDGFDPSVVAGYDDLDIERILSDGGVMRTYKKVAATVDNAKTLLALEREHGDLRNYLRSFASYDQLAADLKKRFRFLGDLSVYYFLFRAGERVPQFEDWEKTVAGDHPRMREMVALARSQGYEG